MVLVGSGIDLTVTGTGRAIFVGDGVYQVRGDGEGDTISSGDWQEPRDEYDIGIEAIVSEEDESTGDESADEPEDEPAADELVNETDSGTDEAGDGDAVTSGNETETETGTDDSEDAS